jgi:hypothetical protein
MKALFNSFAGRRWIGGSARRRTRFELLERRYALDAAAPAAVMGDLDAATDDAAGDVSLAADDPGAKASESVSVDPSTESPVDPAPVASVVESLLNLNVSPDEITISVSLDGAAGSGDDGAGAEGNVTISVTGLSLDDVDLSGVQEAALNLVSSVGDALGGVLDSLGSVDVSADAGVDDSGGSIDVSADSGLGNIDGSVSADAPLGDLLEGIDLGDVTQLVNVGDLTSLVDDVLNDVSLDDLSGVIEPIDPSGLLGGLNLGDLLGAVDASGHADAGGNVSVGADGASVDAGAGGDVSVGGLDLGGLMDTADVTDLTGLLEEVDVETLTSLLGDVLPGDVLNDLNLDTLTDPINAGRVNGLIHSLARGADSGAAQGLLNSLTGGNSPLNLGRVNGLLHSLGGGNFLGGDDSESDLPDLPLDLSHDLDSAIDGVAGDVTSALRLGRGLLV